MSVSVNVCIFYGVCFEEVTKSITVQKFDEDNGKPYNKTLHKQVYRAVGSKGVVEFDYDENILSIDDGDEIGIQSLSLLVDWLEDNPCVEDFLYIGEKMEETEDLMYGNYCNEIDFEEMKKSEKACAVDKFFNDNKWGLVPKFHLLCTVSC